MMLRAINGNRPSFPTISKRGVAYTRSQGGGGGNQALFDKSFG